MAYNNVKVKERQTVSQSSQTQQLGIVSEVPMNEWNVAVSYEKLNLVTYKNATFIAKQKSKGIAPLDTEGWEDTWMLLKAGVTVSSSVVEYTTSDITVTEPPKDGWGTNFPLIKAGELVWTRLTISFTDGTQTVLYSVGIAVAPTKTSELINDGNGTSPYSTQEELATETQRATAEEQANKEAVEQETRRATAAEAENAKGIEDNAKAISDETARAEGVESGLNTRVTDIESKIPADASADNKLATWAFTNSSINNLAAFFITPTAAGDKAFATRAALLAATTFYSGGKARVPTQNDYAIVLADESQPKGVDGTYPTTRYSYQGGTYPNGQWDFQYIVNNTSLTQAQVDALNSGITAAGVAQINTNKSDIAALKTKNTEQDTAINKAQSDAEAAQRLASEKYTLPAGGIPETDMSSSVKDSLARAASALQSVPTATTTEIGGIKIGYSPGGDNYAVLLDEQGRAFVNVPKQKIPTSLPPSGAAGGDLSGTYPNPEIKAGAVSTTKLNNEVQGLLNKAGTAVQREGDTMFGTLAIMDGEYGVSYSATGIVYVGDDEEFSVTAQGFSFGTGSGEDKVSVTYGVNYIEYGSLKYNFPSQSGTFLVDKDLNNYYTKKETEKQISDAIENAIIKALNTPV